MLLPIESCTQPNCHLQEAGVNSHSLAELIVRVLAGEDVDIESPIHPYGRCMECTGRVLLGGKPLPTLVEVRRSVEAGKLAYRRSRRQMKRTARGA